MRKNFRHGLIIATALKIAIIILAYQNVLEYREGEWQIVPGYTWDDYITAIDKGTYTVPPQKSLAGIVVLESSAYRPPIFPYLVYTLHLLRWVGPFLPVVVFSIFTSLVAWFSFLLVEAKGGSFSATVAGVLVFIFPMNFLKSGTLDEAVLMLIFLLSALYIITIEQRKTWHIFAAGILLGCAILTRYTAILAVAGLVFGLALEGRFKYAFVLVMTVLVLLTPWIYRNYLIIGSPVLSTGGARFGVVTTSKQFLETFPEKSIDQIEIDYFTSNLDRYKYLSSMNESERETALNGEFYRRVMADPGLILKSILTKIKVYLPYSYYPVRGAIYRNITYLFFYIPVVFMVIFRLIRFRGYWSFPIWFTAFGYASQGVLFVMTSRHMYPVIVLVIVAFILDAKINGWQTRIPFPANIFGARTDSRA